jgi:hypothetical protein
MRITKVREDIRDPWWQVDISASMNDTIAAAVNEEHHSCNGENTCSVCHALKTGHPLAAAWMLFGATETPALTAAIEALNFNGCYPLPGVAFDVWCASEDSDSIACPECQARIYNDFEYGCGNCLAELELDASEVLSGYIACALWSSSNDLFDTSLCDKCGTRVREFTNSQGTDWRDWSNEMDADCSAGGAHEVTDPDLRLVCVW